MKMLEQGVDLNKKIKADVGEDEEDANERRDKERLKEKLSRTSIAIVRKKPKGKGGAKKPKCTKCCSTN